MNCNRCVRRHSVSNPRAKIENISSVEIFAMTRWCRFYVHLLREVYCNSKLCHFVEDICNCIVAGSLGVVYETCGVSYFHKTISSSVTKTIISVWQYGSKPQIEWSYNKKYRYKQGTAIKVPQLCWWHNSATHFSVSQELSKDSASP